MKKALLFILISVNCFIISSVFAQETITITTYYPAPLGVYQNLRLFPSGQPVCNAAQEGTMYYDNVTIQAMICSRDSNGNPAWQGLGLWTRNGNIIRAADINWDVGVGTVAPQRRLHVFSNGPQLGLEDGLGRWDLWGGANFHVIENNGPGFNDNTRTRIFIHGASDRVRIGDAGTPQAKLEVAGGIRIGDDGDSCTGAKGGTMRYRGGSVEFCNGSTWASIGGNFGGMYSSLLGFFCYSANPLTGDCSCPAGYTTASLWIPYLIWYCYK